MTQLNTSIKNEHIIPSVESSVFSERPDARYALGILAENDKSRLGLESAYSGYYDLRVGTYVLQTGQLTQGDIADDGTDRDHDDMRSIAFGLIENLGHNQRVIGTMRLIVKGREGKDAEPLPVEHDWPEVFETSPARADSFEVSRLIARHEDAKIQQRTKLNLYTAGLSYAMNHHLGPAYAIVESWFARDLGRTMPTQQIGEPKYVEKYLDDNLALEIDLPGYAVRLEAFKPGILSIFEHNESGMTYLDEKGQIIADNKLTDL